MKLRGLRHANVTSPTAVYHSHPTCTLFLWLPPFIYQACSSALPGGGVLGHGIKSTAVLEPFDLCGVEGLKELDLVARTVLGVDNHGHGLANCEFGALDVNLLRGMLAQIGNGKETENIGCMGVLTLSSGLILS